MYTRCLGCHTVHPVNAALLAGGAGKYRCGKCNKVNDALQSLFDEWPAAGAQGAPAGEVPVLGASIDLQGAARARQTSAEMAPNAEEGLEGKPVGFARRWLLPAAWITGAILVLLVATLQWARFQGKSLLELDSIQPTMVRLGLRAPPPRTPYGNLEQIHVVSRELRSHPTRPGQLRLSATLVNRAPQNQPYPEIDVALVDIAGQVVTSARFVPADYLAEGTPESAGLAPHAYLPLVLELEDPGRQAVGFELEFR